MSKFPIPLPAWLAVALVGAAASVAAAHPGSSGVRVEQETTIAIGEDAVTITYTTELNRPGAYLEFLKMDLDGDGSLSAQEESRYFSELGKSLVGGFEARLDGDEVPLVPVGEMELSMPFRRRCRFEIPHPPGWERGAVVELHNDNYLDFPGKITVTLDPGAVADVVYDSRWKQAPEDGQWTAIPAGPLSEPQDRDVVFRYRRGTGKTEPPEDWAEASANPAGGVETGDSAGPGGRALLGGLTIAAALAAVLLCVLIAIIGRARGVAASRLVAACGAVLGLSACLVVWERAAPGRWWSRRVGVPPEMEAAQIFQELHRGIYRAFEARTEGEIYDTLALALEGDVLDEVYNEVYQALRTRSTGNTRFDVRRVKPIAAEVLPAEATASPAFRVRYRWRVYGTVAHFGHTHARFNEYEALYLVKHNGSSWRIAGSQVRQNKRVTMGQS